MDFKENLEKAAEGRYFDPSFASFLKKEAFKQGAEWLMEQPLAERLTEKEREKIRNIYSECELIDMDWNPNLPAYMNDAASTKMKLLISIFGKEMFENKDTD